MSGGSHHNPNGRQAQIGPNWNHLGLQMSGFLSRAPQAAHMSSERATWHTPTPHMFPHTPPDPLQALKVVNAVAANSVFRHTPTPPDIYRHSPTPPEKIYRHTPPPNEVKAPPLFPSPELFNLHQARAAAVAAATLDPLRDDSTYGRAGVDLSVSRSVGLSVRDAPTINNLVRAARVDALLERLQPAHSVIVHPRTSTTPPDMSDDSADSTGTPKRKRKPERTVRVSTLTSSLTPPPTLEPDILRDKTVSIDTQSEATLSQMLTPPNSQTKNEGNSNNRNGGMMKNSSPAPENNIDETLPTEPLVLKINSVSNCARSFDENDVNSTSPSVITKNQDDATVNTLNHVQKSEEKKETLVLKTIETPPNSCSESQQSAQITTANSGAGSTDSGAVKPVIYPPTAELSETPAEVNSTQHFETSEQNALDSNTQKLPEVYVEVENQLEQMFAGIEENPECSYAQNIQQKEISKSTDEPLKELSKTPASRPSQSVAPEDNRQSKKITGGKNKRKKAQSKKSAIPSKKKKLGETRDVYDSGSNASSGKSRGPYIQIRGPRDSPRSVQVVNAAADEDEDGTARRIHRRKASTDGLHTRGLHRSTLGSRYDASTRDPTWVCIFCNLGPHAPRGEGTLGDLFGPYLASVDCDEYRSLEEASRPAGDNGSVEVWMHEDCALWTCGLVAAGARLSGLPEAAWGARGSQCSTCSQPGATICCFIRGCKLRSHFPCALTSRWDLNENLLRAHCAQHKPH